MTKLLLFILCAALAFPVSAQDSPRDRLDNITSYVVYYGVGRADELAAFDLAIVQPDTLTPEELTTIHSDGTLAIAYLSVGEAEPGRPWYTDGRVDPSWELGINPNWGSIFIDASQPGWQQLMVDLAGETLAKGYDGLFLDTVDTVDLFPQTTAGMVRVVERLRETYPDAILVQNRGFTVLDQTQDLIDGLMFESLTTGYDFINEAYIAGDNSFLANELSQLQDETGLVILALDYVEPGNSAGAANAIAAAQSYGFVSAVSTILLDDIPDYGLDAPAQVDVRVKAIDVESDGETVTLVITVENIGLAPADRVSLSLIVDGQQVERHVLDSLDVGQQQQWRYEWANAPQAASVRVTAFSLQDDQVGNNTLNLAFSSDIVAVEPLLPADQQRRRPPENGEDLYAYPVSVPITIDGDLAEWADIPCAVVDQADQITFGDPAGWSGADDLSGHVCYAWDADNLYVAFAVTDDIIVQGYAGTDLWRGDHVELWFDTQLQLDFDSAVNSDDDFQIGVSPGSSDEVPPSLIVWTPARLPEQWAEIEYAVVQTETGYAAEIRFPAVVLTGLRLAPDHAIGATFDPSDTDTPGSSEQELMLSTAPETLWGVPTLWNNLILLGQR